MCHTSKIVLGKTSGAYSITRKSPVFPSMKSMKRSVIEDQCCSCTQRLNTVVSLNKNTHLKLFPILSMNFPEPDYKCLRITSITNFHAIACYKFWTAWGEFQMNFMKKYLFSFLDSNLVTLGFLQLPMTALNHLSYMGSTLAKKMLK